MINVYDFLLNFNDELYSFYEWEESDQTMLLKKGILFKVTDYIYIKFLSNNIDVSDEFLNLIKDKTEVIIGKRKEKIQYSSIITNGKSALGLIFNSNGNIVKKSSFMIEDELELIDIASRLKEKKIPYKNIMNKKYNYSFLTRKEKENVDEIIKELESIKDEKEKIKYLYYEWFNKKVSNDNYYDELVNSIKITYNDSLKDFMNLLNLVTIKE